MDTPIGQFLLIGNFRRRLARELLVRDARVYIPPRLRGAPPRCWDLSLAAPLPVSFVFPIAY